MARLNFNAATVQPQQPPEAIPAGWYNAMIVGSEIKPTKDNATTGACYLELDLKVIDGPYVNRHVYARLNIKNANPTAQEIAWQQLSAICHAVGVIQCEDTQQLHNRPLQVRVSFRPAEGQYDASNDVKAYKAIEGGAPGAPVAGGAPASAPDWAGQQAPAPAAPAPTPPAPAQAPAAPPVAHAPTYPGAPAPTAPAAPPAATTPGPASGAVPDWAKPAQ